MAQIRKQITGLIIKGLVQSCVRVTDSGRDPAHLSSASNREDVHFSVQSISLEQRVQLQTSRCSVLLFVSFHFQLL